jgi:hypothetical protein
MMVTDDLIIVKVRSSFYQKPFIGLVFVFRIKVTLVKLIKALLVFSIVLFVYYGIYKLARIVIFRRVFETMTERKEQDQ